MAARETVYLESLDAQTDAGQHFIFAYQGDLSLPPDAHAKAFLEFLQRTESERATPDSMMLDVSIYASGQHGNFQGLKREMQLAERYQINVQMHYLEPGQVHERKCLKLM